VDGKLHRIDSEENCFLPKIQHRSEIHINNEKSADDDIGNGNEVSDSSYVKMDVGKFGLEKCADQQMVENKKEVSSMDKCDDIMQDSKTVLSDTNKIEESIESSKTEVMKWKEGEDAARNDVNEVQERIKDADKEGKKDASCGGRTKLDSI
jgi:hypothetical protein